MSNVPLPEPPSDDPLRYVEGYDEAALRSYGDARAAEARRLALLEAIELAENSMEYTRADLIDSLRFKLRALADQHNTKEQA